MYSRNTPLWANTYHIFQTSSHGKYRYEKVADIEVDGTQPITVILRDLQEDGINGMYLDEYLKSLSFSKLKEIVGQIKAYIESLDNAKDFKIGHAKVKSGKGMGTVRYKSLDKLSAHLDKIFKTGAQKEQKRLAKEAKQRETETLKLKTQLTKLGGEPLDTDTISDLTQKISDAKLRKQEAATQKLIDKLKKMGGEVLDSDTDDSLKQKISDLKEEKAKAVTDDLKEKLKSLGGEVLGSETNNDLREKIKSIKVQREKDKLTEAKNKKLELDNKLIALGGVLDDNDTQKDVLKKIERIEKANKAEKDIELAAKENYEKQKLPLCNELFNSNGNDAQLKGAYYQVDLNNKQSDILIVQEDDINSAFIRRMDTKDLKSRTKKGLLQNKFLIKDNKFVGSEDVKDCELVTDIPIPDKNIINGNMLTGIQMNHSEYQRLPSGEINPLYTLTKWKTNRNRKGKIEELKPDVAQLKVLVCNPKDVLIAHKPGQGKTANSILLAEMKRNIMKKEGKTPPRILIIAPKAQILLQWQEQVIKWGMDPRHWIFQTKEHFYISQTTNRHGYPHWDTLDAGVKKMYDEVWKHPAEPRLDASKLNEYNNGTVEGSKNSFFPPLDSDLKRGEIADKLERCVIDCRRNKWIHGLRTDKMRWNGSDFSDIVGNKDNTLDEEKYSREFLIVRHLFRPTSNGKIQPQWLKIRNQRDHLLFVMGDDEYVNVISDLEAYQHIDDDDPSEPYIVSSRSSIYKPSGRNHPLLQFMEGDLPSLRGIFSKCDSISEMKDAIIKEYESHENAPKIPAINTIDKFLSNTHGQNLVQHRYIAEKDTIFIIDECHKALSSKGADLPMTECFMKYGQHSVANILVSATPFLSGDYFGSMITLANFLNRQYDGIGEGNDVSSVYSDIIEHLSGKVTRVLYEEEFEENEEKVKELKYLSLKAPDYNGEKFMKSFLFGNEVNWKAYSQTGRYGMRKEDKEALALSALKTLFVEKENKRENEFPSKIALNKDGFINIEKDVVRRDIHRFSVLDGEPDMIVAPDFASTTLANATNHEADSIIFHEEVSNELRERFSDKPYFFPLVVSVKTTEQENGISAIQELQRMAYETKDKWIVVMHVDSPDADIDQLLKRINVTPYNSNDPLSAPPQFNDNRSRRYNIPDSIKTYLEQEVSECPVSWLPLKSPGATRSRVHCTNVPECVSSKIKTLVHMVENAVKTNKNVLIYADSIELMNAIEQGFKVRKNTRAHLWEDSVGDEMITRMKKNKRKKWSKWEEESRKDDISACEYLCRRDKNDHDKISTLKRLIRENMISLSPSDVEEAEMYTYVAYVNESENPLHMKRLKEATYTSNDSNEWECADGTMVLDKRKKNGTFPQTRTQYIRWKLDTWSKLKDIGSYFKQYKTNQTNHFSKRSPSAYLVFGGYKLFFDSLEDLYEKDRVLMELQQLCDLMRVQYNVKTIRGDPQEIYDSLDKLVKKLDKTYSCQSEKVNTCIQEFIQFAESYLVYQLLDIGLLCENDKPFDTKEKSSKPLWSETQREQATKILEPFKIRYERIKNDVIPYVPDVLKEHVAKLKGTYYDSLELPDKVPKKILHELDIFVTELSPNDELYITADMNVEKYDNFTGQFSFLSNTEYLKSVLTEKRKKDIFYNFGYTYKDISGDLYLSPSEKDYFNDLKKELVELIDVEIDHRRVKVSEELSRVGTLLKENKDWVIPERINELTNSMVHQDITKFFNTSHTLTYALSIQRLLEALRKNGDALDGELTQSTLYSKMSDDDKKKLITATHHTGKIQQHEKELEKIKKDRKLDRLIHIKKMMNEEKRGKGPSDNAFKYILLRSKDREDITLERIRKKVARFKTLKKKKRLDLSSDGNMSLQDVVDMLDEYETLNAAHKHPFKINDYKWLNIVTYLNNYKWKTEGGEGEIVPGTVKLQNTTPKPNPYQKPMAINTPYLQRDIYRTEDIQSETPRNEDGSVRDWSREFSYLRQTDAPETISKIKERVSGNIPDKVVFGMMSGKHTPSNDEKEMYKVAFQTGLVDCLVMNNAIREGIDFSSLRETLCIMIEPQKIPGVVDQFVGRVVRKKSHQACPKEFRKVKYVILEDIMDEEMEVREYVTNEPTGLIPCDVSVDIFRGTSESSEQMLMNRFGMMKVQDDEADLNSGVGSTDSAISQIKQRTAEKNEIRKLIKEKFSEWTDNQIRDAIRVARKKLDQNATVAQIVAAIVDPLDKKRYEFKSGISIEKDDEEQIQTTMDHVVDYASGLVGKNSTYVNISTCVLYKNHAFFTPMQFLESNLQYEYGPRQYYDPDMKKVKRDRKSPKSSNDEPSSTKSTKSVRTSKKKPPRKRRGDDGGTDGGNDDNDDPDFDPDAPESDESEIEDASDDNNDDEDTGEETDDETTDGPDENGDWSYKMTPSSNMMFVEGESTPETGSAPLKKVDKVEEVVQMGYTCFVCNFQNTENNSCKVCGVPLGDYIAMEPYYLDYSIDANPWDISTDTTRKSVFKKIESEMQKINMDLAAISIEHTGKCKADLTIKISTELSKGSGTFMQRIEPKTCVPFDYRKARSRFDLVHAIDISSRDSVNTADVEEYYIESEYDSDY